MAWYWYVIIAIGAYIVICFIDAGIKASSMKPEFQNEKYGETRYEELKKQGVQTDYKIYTEEEIANDPTKGSVRLVYMPPKGKEKTRYMLVCPGGGYLNLATVGEGYCIGAKVNEKGFTAFVLEYRVRDNCSYHAPEKDVARAISFINENADRFNVETEGYSLCGFSAGGNLVGLFGTDDYGYKNFDGISKPSAIIMGYPWCNPNEKLWNVMQLAVVHQLNKKGCGAFLSGDVSQRALDTMRVHKHITKDYPATYVIQGDQDILVPKNTHSDVLVKALKENGVTCKYEVFHKLNHGFGLCNGGPAEGWLDSAIGFWNAQL